MCFYFIPETCCPNWKRIISDIQEKISLENSNHIYHKTQLDSVAIENLISNIEIMEKLYDIVKNDVKSLDIEIVSVHVNFILESIIRSETYMSQQLIYDYNNELLRIKYLIGFTKIKSNLGYKYNEAILALYQSKEITKVEAKYLNDYLVEYGGIAVEERIIIVKAISLRQGNWYKCQCGNIYCFPEAEKNVRCPECNVLLAGINHIRLINIIRHGFNDIN